MSELGSAPLPGLSGADHVRGPADGTLLIEYADFECPFCAAVSARLRQLPFRHAFRHFPVSSRHPRAWAAACAAEAAALQDRFWEMYELLFADQGRLEDPHLWARASELDLDLKRFERDRRSEEVRARVRRDFEAGVRAGVVSTPTLFSSDQVHSGSIDLATLRGLSL